LAQAIASGELIDARLQGYTALHLATLYGNVDAALMLIERGADPNLLDREGHGALHMCALSNSMSDAESARVAAALIRHGADRHRASSTGDTAESYAENRGKERLLEVLREVQP
jgi:ankyrin repeat protein